MAIFLDTNSFFSKTIFKESGNLPLGSSISIIVFDPNNEPLEFSIIVFSISLIWLESKKIFSEKPDFSKNFLIVFFDSFLRTVSDP